ncbi:hypothetical protein GPJ56_000104 [Histomonas meleagridis]|uniref:uncharacterized protein n=1 Tax=Histomonas meleagridis TaxID=135588 RepID=UPI00355A1AD7|nr:hypothetical protein GPJ56_000104 [Histomonas meleagridis]KAH0805603.1 hypothetical protein GO595_001658 [Histomonas meleagridis]
MNFYDVYTTLSYNPDMERPLNQICEYLGCRNTLEELKQALFKKPSRAQFGGAFPFDEETGRIYDALWKAADAENYSTATKIGRWIMKTICPPADDEGMGAYHMKPRSNYESREPEEVPQQQYEPTPKSETNYETPLHNDNDKWEIEDDADDIIVVDAKPKPSKNTVTKRTTNKKGD